MRLFESRPALRWLVPVAVLGVVAGTSLIASTATADPALPPRTAEQLLVDVQNAQLTDLSGTVVQTSDLGLPELPGLGGGGEGLTALLSGTHTLDVWLSGEDKARLAIRSTLGEYDVIRNGSHVWTWQSSDNSATHRTLPADAAAAERGEHPTPEGTPQTPQEIADELLDAIQPTTDVATDRTVSVAGRDAYELVLTPKTSGSLLTEVTIAVDAVTHSPLRVRVYAGQTVVFEVGYTTVDFNRPEDRQFAFVAPPGADVTEVPASDAKPRSSTPNPDDEKSGEPKVVGAGWSTVVIVKMDADPTAGEQQGNRGGGADLQRALAALPTVQGDWGTGRLLTSKAFSVVITDDGRVAAGAVAPSLLYAALEK